MVKIDKFKKQTKAKKTAKVSSKDDKLQILKSSSKAKQLKQIQKKRVNNGT